MRAIRAVYLVAMTAVVGLLCSAAAGSTAQAADTSASAVVVQQVAAAAPLDEPTPTPTPAPVAPVVEPEPVAPPRVPVQVPGTPCLDTARACVDLSANRAWLISNGQVEYGPVPITSGRRGFRTPPGTFHVSYKSRNHVSSIYDAEMPYSVFFNGGIAFHQGSLRQQSHGCIHLSRSAAQTFFGALNRGDVVQVVR